MKKLMVAFAAIALGVSAQAAQVSWTAYTYSGGEIADYSYLVNKDGTLVTSMETGYSIVLAKIVGDFTGSDWTATELSTAMIGSDSSIGGSYNFSASSGSLADNDVIAAVLKDDKGNFSKIQYYDGGDVTETMKITGLSSAGDLYSAEFDFAHDGNVLNVPEPTSGLLLLLGMGALALRRRRA